MDRDESKQKEEPILAQLAELRAYVLHFVVATLDLIALRIKTHLWAVVIACVCIVVGLILAGGFAFYLLHGIAGGAAAAFDSVWLGNLVTGAVGITSLLVGAAYWTKRQQSNRHEQKVVKYERRKRQQRERFGRDVDGSAAAA